MQPNAPKLSTSPFILKWVFPALYLGALGVFFTMAILSQANVPWPMLLFPVLIIGCSVPSYKHFFWALADEVYDEGDCLRVRKGSQEERIAFRQMPNVAAPRMMNPRQISIRLRAPCSLGDEIIFLPKRRNDFTLSLSPCVRDPVVEDLILRVDAARRQG